DSLLILYTSPGVLIFVFLHKNLLHRHFSVKPIPISQNGYTQYIVCVTVKIYNILWFSDILALF
ncbi:hypothetical protein SU69_03090, partial [Thermosipho melanesiensis]|uniref:hypothetical protein n=1 Tax=Thermosipho melanesiensis TaxID=46541 RepID=UPI0009D2A99E